MHNKVTLIGRLGKDPELKQFEDGNKVATFSIATHENYKDKNGEWQQKTEWHRVVCWGKTAGIVADNYKKGDTMLIEGKVTYRTWEDANGHENKITEVVAHLIRRLQKAPDGQSEGVMPGNAYARKAPQPSTTSDGGWEGEVPF